MPVDSSWVEKYILLRFEMVNDRSPAFSVDPETEIVRDDVDTDTLAPSVISKVR
jgi:hypothetical protein